MSGELNQEAVEIINSALESNMKADENDQQFCDIEVR